MLLDDVAAGHAAAVQHRHHVPWRQAARAAPPWPRLRPRTTAGAVVPEQPDRHITVTCARAYDFVQRLVRIESEHLYALCSSPNPNLVPIVRAWFGRHCHPVIVASRLEANTS